MSLIGHPGVSPVKMLRNAPKCVHIMSYLRQAAVLKHFSRLFLDETAEPRQTQTCSAQPLCRITPCTRQPVTRLRDAIIPTLKPNSRCTGLSIMLAINSCVPGSPWRTYTILGTCSSK